MTKRQFIKSKADQELVLRAYFKTFNTYTNHTDSNQHYSYQGTKPPEKKRRNQSRVSTDSNAVIIQFVVSKINLFILFIILKIILRFHVSNTKNETPCIVF